MQWKNLSISKKIGSAFVVVMLVVVVGIIFIYREVNSEFYSTEQMMKGSEYQVRLLQAEIAHLQWAANVSAYIRKEGKGTLTAVADGTQCSFGKWFYSDSRKQLEQLMPETATHFEAIETPHLALHKSLENISAALKNGDIFAANSIYENDVQKYLAAVQLQLGKAREIVSNNINELSNSLLASMIEVKQLMWADVLAMLVVGIGVTLCLSRYLSVELNRMVNFAQAVAGGAVQRFTMTRKDEVGKLGRALDTMVMKLQEKIAEADAQTSSALAKETEALTSQNNANAAMEKVAEKNLALCQVAQKLEVLGKILNTAIERLSVQIEEARHNAAYQATKLAETAGGMEEMSAAVVEVARSAHSAAELAASTRQKAKTGESIVQQTLNSIKDASRKSQALKADMEGLTQHATNINQVMNVISDIADQTNLLALNAAIEAARAGDAGRGFAVVADEVRKLAEKTLTSTTNVATAIHAIQESAKSNMQHVDSSVHSVEQASELSSQSGATLAEILSMAENSADRVQGIATASEQQSQVSAAISGALSSINQVVAQTAEAMTTATEEIHDLSRQAQELDKMIRQLRED